MKNLISIILLLFISANNLLGQNEDSFFLEKRVDAPGMKRQELNTNAYKVLSAYSNYDILSPVVREYDYAYSFCTPVVFSKARLTSNGRNYRADIQYNLAIYSYDGYYVIKMHRIMPTIRRMNGILVIDNLPNEIDTAFENYKSKKEMRQTANELKSFLTNEFDTASDWLAKEMSSLGFQLIEIN